MKQFLIVILLAASLAAVAQQPAPPAQPQANKLTPKVQTDELAKTKAELARANAKIAWESIKGLQLQANQMQVSYQNSLKELQAKYASDQKTMNDYKDAVCKENGWTPSEVNYDAESDSWTKIPKPPVAKAAEKPAEKK